MSYWAWNERLCALLKNHKEILFAPWLAYYSAGMSPEQAIIEVLG
jgi:hypothetical protein